MKLHHFLLAPTCAIAALIGILNTSAQQQAGATPPIELKQIPQLARPEALDGNAAPIRPPKPPGKTPKRFESLEAMQDAYFSLFRTKPGFGASRILTFPVEDQLMLDGYTYQFAAPDLIGLEDEPLAYRRRLEMISMAELTNRTSRARLQTRPLTADEVRAVAELRAGRNLAVFPARLPVVTLLGTNEVAGLLAVGALRARTECVKCHQCAEGALLGAFSYQLVPTNPTAIVPTLARADASR